MLFGLFLFCVDFIFEWRPLPPGIQKLFLFLQLVPVGPVALVLLAGAGNGKRCGGHVIGHGGPGGNIRAFSDVNGCDEIRVAADEGIVVDNRADFFTRS